MSWLGDFAVGSTFDTKFCTVNSSGVPTQLAGTPVISAYVDNSLTQLTAGITLTVDFDGVTGLNNVRVVATAGNGYAAGSNYQLVITTGTVGGSSVVGYVVAEFSLETHSSLRPTTAGRTLDVSATGEAGLDWANIGAPTTAQNLSATNIDVDQVVASVSGAVGSVTGAVGSVTGAVGSVTGSVASVTGAVGSVTGSVGSVAAGGITAGSFAAGAIDAAAIATDAIGASELAQGAADKVWSSVTRTLTANNRLTKNAALSNFMFLMIDSTDHVTPKTSLTFVAGDSQVSIDGAAFVNTTNLPAEVASGIYRVNLAAADTNGDVLTLKFSKAGADTRLISVVTQTQ